MLATSKHLLLLYFKTFPIFIMILQIVEPLSFNITNFSDPESASLIQNAGVARIENGSIVLNPLIDSITIAVGRAIYSEPLSLKTYSNGNATDFSTRFSFTIDITNKTNYGYGFAFYIAPLAFAYHTPPNSSGLLLGLYGDTQNNIVAVEFDTFVNENDPPMKHVGINNNSVASLQYKKFDIENNIGKMGHALITYNSSAKLLSVSWFFEGTSSGFTPSDSLSYQIDLGRILPKWVTVGFSGATSKEQNLIHSWEFSPNLDLNSTNREVNNEDVMIITKYKVKVKVVVVVVAGVICSIIVVLMVISITWFIIKKRRTDDGFDLDKVSMPRRFGYKELVAATNGFADDRRLGEGGYGQVYKGFLTDLGRVVAVKRIYSDVEDSEKIFTNEVNIISRLIHRNLVQFIGWCHEQGELLMVLEYMTNGSLDTHLFDSNRRTLSWGVRYKIALGVARALRYLHEDAEQCVLHRDIKSSNVLLDTDFNTKVGDFGIAKLVDPRLRTQKTRVVGTYGYLAPEYINQGRASKESDIYSFGVVALEIACGRKTYQDEKHNHVPLVNWVWKHYVKGNILKVADKGLNMDFDVDEITCLLTVGLWCTLHDHKKRPKAEEVINVLIQVAPFPKLET